MQFFETVFFFIVTLGVLVFVHELGHFLAAKMCGMRAEVFAFGMGYRLFGYNKVNGFTFWRLEKDVELGENTDYRIAAFPIGGYVKIPGMIDESFDTDHISRPPQPWEFRAKPIWQRMIVISAGVIMNILLAVVIFWGINYNQGKMIRETTEVEFVAKGSPAELAGFQAGDKIVQINDTPVRHWDQITALIYFDNAGQDLTFLIQRNNAEMILFLARSSIPEPKELRFGLSPGNTEIVVSGVEPDLPADKIGLQPLDVIVSLNGEPVRHDQPVVEIVRANAGKALAVEWRRGNETMRGTTVPTDDGRIGISFTERYVGPVTQQHYSLLEALPEAIRDIERAGRLFVTQIAQIVIGRQSFAQSVGGPIKIAQMATQSAEVGLTTYLTFMALLSISLAILNILPFPALDGGHLIFLLIEGILRREIPVNVRLGFQKLGLALLLAFMAFVIYNDIRTF